VWNLLYVILLVHRNLGWLLDFWKIVDPCVIVQYKTEIFLIHLFSHFSFFQ